MLEELEQLNYDCEMRELAKTAKGDDVIYKDRGGIHKRYKDLLDYKICEVKILRAFCEGVTSAIKALQLSSIVLMDEPSISHIIVAKRKTYVINGIPDDCNIFIIRWHELPESAAYLQELAGIGCPIFDVSTVEEAIKVIKEF